MGRKSGAGFFCRHGSHGRKQAVIQRLAREGTFICAGKTVPVSGAGPV
ncbi:hypothetical protein [Brucella anthropi]